MQDWSLDLLSCGPEHYHCVCYHNTTLLKQFTHCNRSHPQTAGSVPCRYSGYRGYSTATPICRTETCSAHNGSIPARPLPSAGTARSRHSALCHQGNNPPRRIRIPSVRIHTHLRKIESEVSFTRYADSLDILIQDLYYPWIISEHVCPNWTILGKCLTSLVMIMGHVYYSEHNEVWNKNEIRKIGREIMLNVFSHDYGTYISFFST